MKYQTINGVINKPILDGFIFDDIIPSSDCKVLKKRKKNACNSVEEVIYSSRKYIHETKEIAEKLEGNSIQDTCRIIQDFLSAHIRYSFNDNNKIKSPSCVWSSKTADCKSFTVFASTILYNLGINHFLKTVSSKGGAESHIYVIVPVNQDIKKLPLNAQFNKDYFVVDGTLTTGKYYEPEYEKKLLEINMAPETKDKKFLCLSANKMVSKIVLLGIIGALFFSANNK